MRELGNVIVMKSLLGQGEMTLNFSRAFIKTDGVWQMLLSYRSIVRDDELFEPSEAIHQLRAEGRIHVITKERKRSKMVRFSMPPDASC
jgi:hypothetical protein